MHLTYVAHACPRPQQLTPHTRRFASLPPPPPGQPYLSEEEQPELLVMQRQLLAHVEQLQLPPNFLDALIGELGGPGAVAEMTGRKGRVVKDGRGRMVYELRAKPDSNEMDSLNGEGGRCV